jgi:glycine betaine/proline transport system substrate-binding protein
MLSQFLGFKKWTLVVLILVMAFSAGCDNKKDDDDDKNDDKSTESSNSTGPDSDKPLIKLVIEPWDGAAVNVEVAKYIIENEMGYPVEFVEASGSGQFDAIASGNAHASLEVWPSGNAELIVKHIDTDKTILRGGDLGVVGKVGWFIPTYVARARPELTTWEGYLVPDNALFFDTERTEGTKGQFVIGDINWGHYDDQIIENLDMDFELVATESEDKFVEMLDEVYKAEEPILFYFWTPHWAFNVYDMTEVELPPYTDECYTKKEEGGVDCNYPTEILFKMYSPTLPEYAPEVYEFLENFQYSNQEQIGMMASMKLEGKTAEQAAIEWIETHEDVWREWLPEGE